MDHTYLRYKSSDNFGIITAPQTPIFALLPNIKNSSNNKISRNKKKNEDLMVITSNLQAPAIWRFRQGSLYGKLPVEYNSNEHTIRKLEKSVISIMTVYSNNTIAVGYSDGVLRVFDFEIGIDGISHRNINNLDYIGEQRVSLIGHRKSISCLCFNFDGSILASGSKDCEIVLWDMVAESGLCRLRKAHQDEVTGISFVYKNSPKINYGIAYTKLGQNLSGLEETIPSTSSSTLNITESAINIQYLISISKDTLIKVWDLAQEHCIQTIVGHRTEIWSLNVEPKWHSFLLTGSNDDQIRFYKINNKNINNENNNNENNNNENNNNEIIENNNNINYENFNFLEYIGSISRESKQGRTHEITFRPDGKYLSIISKSNIVEIYYIRNEDEIKKRIKRRIKRVKEREKKHLNKDNNNIDIINDNNDNNENILKTTKTTTATDIMEIHSIIRCNTNVRSSSFSPQNEKLGGSRIILSLINNSLELYSIPPIIINNDASTIYESTHISTVDLVGHRTPIKAIKLSNDDRFISTLSNGLLKLWSTNSLQCILSCPTGDGVSLIFGPYDRTLIVGTKLGELYLYDVASGECIWEDTTTHTGTIWSIDLKPDLTSIVTGGVDGEIRFWEFQTINNKIILEHNRTLKMNDEIMCLKYNKTLDSNKLLIAVALLDHTVRVFYEDSLKFFLSLYGHRLPVLTIDFSDDNTLIATGSADRTIKIWGTDFGDCHYSLLAHDDQITELKFIPKTHYIFSCSKDHVVKQWDLDRFKKILTLRGNISEIWGLDISHDGSFVLTCGNDLSIRKWVKTDEILIIEEEEEKELEELYEKDIINDKENNILNDISYDNNDNNENDIEGGIASKRTTDTISSVDRLIDAIDLIEFNKKNDNQIKKYKNNNKLQKKFITLYYLKQSSNPLFLNLSPINYFLKILTSIPSSQLEQTLLLLPFHYISPLFLDLLLRLIQNNLNIELCSKCLFFLLKSNQTQIISTLQSYESLNELKSILKNKLEEQKYIIGSNMAGLKYIQQVINDEKNKYMLEPIINTDNINHNLKRKKNLWSWGDDVDVKNLNNNNKKKRNNNEKKIKKKKKKHMKKSL